MTMKLNSMLGIAVLLGCFSGPFSSEVIAENDNQADAEQRSVGFFYPFEYQMSLLKNQANGKS